MKTSRNCFTSGLKQAKSAFGFLKEKQLVRKDRKNSKSSIFILEKEKLKTAKEAAAKLKEA